MFRIRPHDERGQATAEYAVGATVGVTAIAAVLVGPDPIVADWLSEFVVEQVKRSLSFDLPDLVRWPW